jgi:nicotinic acid mononucleotide adenylyltransferase
LRNRAADGLSVRDHVPDAVADLIESHDLYRRSR